jgi:diguanylate cyclase (GGDEF)-like protein
VPVKRLVRTRNVVGLAAATTITMLILSAAWAFRDQHDIAIQNVERWRFAAVSTMLCMLSLVTPGIMLAGRIRKLSRAVCELVEAKSRAEVLAQQDPLTGLLNRRAFLERLGIELQQRAEPIAVLLIDLDFFKEINDSIGHLAADRVLCVITERLYAATPRDRAITGRLGGDEFVVAMWQYRDRGEIERLATRMLALLAEPVEVSGASDPVSITATIGASESWAGSGSPAELLQRADRAMYHGKIGGRAVFRFFDEALELQADEREEAALGEARAWRLRLASALDRNLITAVFQPLISLRERKLVGFEVLARWDDAEHGPVSPTQFIPMAEVHGVIEQLARQIIMSACLSASAWDGSFSLAFNVSAIQLRDGTLPALIAEAVAGTGFPLERLHIEITETALVENIDAALETVRQIKAMGVGIVLDDFGTGFSSLSRLQTLPFDIIKVDTSFVRSMLESPASAKIVAAVIGLGRSLGLVTVAEGVETEALADMLQEMNCEIGQGWLFGHGIPAAEVPAFLATVEQFPQVLKGRVPPGSQGEDSGRRHGL